MRNVIATSPFLEPGDDGTVAGGSEYGACCILPGEGQGGLLPCGNLQQVQCALFGGVWRRGSCSDLDKLGFLDSEGRCFFRRCINYPAGSECVEWVGDFPPCSPFGGTPCSPGVIGRCLFPIDPDNPDAIECSDELGACCKVHLGGGCEEGFAETKCEGEFGFFMGLGSTCSNIEECPTDDPPEGCREFEDREVPLGLRQWSSDVCSGVAMEILLDDRRDAIVMTDRHRLFGIPAQSATRDPCKRCQTTMSFGFDGDANAPTIGNAQDNNPLYNKHYRAWMVLDEHGLYGKKYDAILVGSYETPPWAEFLFMSHGTYCQNVRE